MNKVESSSGYSTHSSPPCSRSRKQVAPPLFINKQFDLGARSMHVQYVSQPGFDIVDVYFRCPALSQ